MIYSVALACQTNAEAIRHLIRHDRQEDLCFALWYPSHGARRFSGLIQHLVLPREGEREVHGNAWFSSAYFDRALAMARECNAGLALMHSHLGPGWQGMSADDVQTEERFAAPTLGATGLPLLGLTVGTDSAWSARFWIRVARKTYERQWCETVRVVGERLDVTYNSQLRPVPPPREQLLRTVSAWGDQAQGRLARLRVGVIGVGSVGSMVAEALARMGICDVLLMDFDVVKPHNLDRLFNATPKDAEILAPKVTVMARALRQSATAAEFAVIPLEYSVVEEEGFRAALDCDVLFSCVDRPWPRNVLNFIAYAHLIPVIDGGIHAVINRSATGLRDASWPSHVAAPTRRCMECLQQFTPEDSSLERSGLLDDPVYIQGMPKDSALLRNENVFAFSMSLASFEVLHLLSMVVLPPPYTNAGEQMYDFLHGELRVLKRGCGPTCPYPALTALGDRSGISFVGEHQAARAARAAREAQRTEPVSIPEDEPTVAISVPTPPKSWLAWLHRRLTRRHKR
jgi:hypothetical protein